MTVVDDTVGSVLIGIFVGAILYGVTTTQTYVYYQNYPDDSKLFKYIVGILWILETAHTGFCIDFIYAYLVTHFGDLAFINNIWWSGGMTVLLGVFVSAAVHSYYVRRVWILSKRNIWITSAVAIMAVTRFCFGIVTTVLSYHYAEWTVFRHRKLPLITLTGGLAAAAAVDLTVAIALSVYLQQNRTGFQRSDSRINMLLSYTINTGAITTVVSLLVVITFITIPGSLVFLGLVEIQSKLYANSFLASLNARNKILNRKHPSQYPSYELDRSQVRSHTRNGAPLQQIEIFQETTRTVDMMNPSESSVMKHKESLV